MRRMKEKASPALGFLTLVSLILCTTAILLWPLSYFQKFERELITDANGWHVLVVWWGNGRIGAEWWSISESIETRQAIQDRWAQGEGRKRFYLDLPPHGVIHFFDSLVEEDQERCRAARVYDFDIPILYWIPVTGALPALWFYKRMKLKCHKAVRCPNCGYDLRATPDRCPECGKTTKTAELPNISQSKT
jgi:hypothetical protein